MDVAHFPVDAAELTVGMFVVELDRPWSESPFLIEGFLIEDDETIFTLKKLCRQVFIDARCSAFNSLPDFARALLRPPPTADKVVTRFIAPPKAVVTTTPERLPGEPEWLKKEGFVPNGAARVANAEWRGLVVSAQEASLRELPAAPLEAPTLSAQDRAQMKRLLAELLTQPVDQAIKRVARARESIAASMTGTFARSLMGFKHLFGKKEGSTIHGTRPVDDGPIKILIYDDLTHTEGELARAKHVYERAFVAWEAMSDALVEDVALDIADLEQAARLLASSIIANPDGLTWWARTRPDTQSRARRAICVAVAMMTHGRHLGMTQGEIEHLGLAGLLMDVGLVLVPPLILEKPGRLSLDEYEVIKTHVELVSETVGRSVPLHTSVIDAITQHHERLDGSGYPNALESGAISVFGRMAAIADAYCALTSLRTYALPVAPFDAVLILLKRSGQWFDPDLLETFVQAVGTYPVGSMVQLSTGEVACVIRSNRKHRLQPVVMLVSTPDQKPLSAPRKLDLTSPAAKVVGHERKIARGLPCVSGAWDMRYFHEALEA